MHLCPDRTRRYAPIRGIKTGVVSPLNRNVQEPVKICVTSDSLHKVQLGSGMPFESRQMTAIDKVVINATRIHIVRLIKSSLFCVYQFVIWSGKSSSSTVPSGTTRLATEWPASIVLFVSPVISGCQSGRSFFS